MPLRSRAQNVEKNISRVGTWKTAIGSSQGIVNKGLLMCRRRGDWISGRRRALHHLKKENPSLRGHSPGRRVFYFPFVFKGFAAIFARQGNTACGVKNIRIFKPKVPRRIWEMMFILVPRDMITSSNINGSLCTDFIS